jgi:hemolysin D
MPLRKVLDFSRHKALDPKAEAKDKPALKLVKSALDDLTPQEREFLPHLLEIEETPPSPVQRGVLWTILALVGVAIAWSCIGEISVVSTAQGKFIPDGRVKQIQPMETSVVKAIHVKEGQHVKAGEVLLELDPTINAAELQSSSRQLGINRMEQARLAAELGNTAPKYAGAPEEPGLVALQENLRRSREATYASKLAEAEALVSEKESALAGAQATLRKYEELTELSKQREEDARPLLTTGALSRLDYMQVKQDLVTNLNDFAAQAKAVEQARHARTEVMHQLDGVRHGRATDIYTDLDKKIYDASSLVGSVDKARQLYDLKWLRSPVDGLVQRVDVTTTGGVVTPAQSLVTIVPDGTPIIVEASLSNEDVGYVRLGQDVEIKVDTFPFQKYGTLKGKLVWISPDAEEKNQGGDSGNGNTSNSKSAPDPKAAKSTYMYKVHVQPEKTMFIVDGMPTPIQVGMTVQTDITTDHRKIVEFFLSPLIKYLDEGLKVR